MKINKNCHFLLITLLFLFISDSFAQDTTQSLAFKKNKPRKRTNLFYQPDLSYQIWQQFNLIKEANAGDPLAQHELGIRYLLGDGMKADTTLGAYWIKKAAGKKLPAAAFNYGILLLNGWGVEWNPFMAFDQFKTAANDGMPAAQHIVGLFYTDNLIVKRDLKTAYVWLKKAADTDFEPAKKPLEEISKKIDTASIDTSAIKRQIASENSKSNIDIKDKGNNSISSSLGLVFIDFDAAADTTVKIESETLLEDLNYIGNKQLTENIYINSPDGKDSTLSFDSLDVSLVLKFAENGSPEALTLLGRFYEEGKYFKQDLITASAYYIRAMRMDSPRAPFLLYEMIKAGNYYAQLRQKVDNNDAEAMFVWHGLHTLGFDNRIAERDALNLLTKSASLRYLPAMSELGLSYYTGKTGDEDKSKAISIWKDAERLGSKEAKVRIETAIIFDTGNPGQYQYSFEELLEAAEDGSLLSQVSLAYCYETGKGTKMSMAEAVKYYRYAAQRGSQYAYKELQRIYDSVRPDESIYNIN
ncbi:MAG: tetratricopeptide repeat protein [Ignavibacteriaceae bacterium]